MKPTDALRLIQGGILKRLPQETWADLGCGSGTFTYALATLLGAGSKIKAIDIEHQVIQTFEGSASVEFAKGDFIKDDLPLSDLDGILMANSLHYVRDKSGFVQKLSSYLKPSATMVIVEYDTNTPNPWVPYPLDFDRLMKTFPSYGFEKVHKIGERASMYRNGKIYACVVSRS
jgi:ubiquinone/menaquinone biosynthesis C-methylase UbiE